MLAQPTSTTETLGRGKGKSHLSKSCSLRRCDLASHCPASEYIWLLYARTARFARYTPEWKRVVVTSRASRDCVRGLNAPPSPDSELLMSSSDGTSPEGRRQIRGPTSSLDGCFTAFVRRWVPDKLTKQPPADYEVTRTARHLQKHRKYRKHRETALSRRERHIPTSCASSEGMG